MSMDVLHPGPESGSASGPARPGFRLAATRLPELDGFRADDLGEAYRAFLISARASAAGRMPLRPGKAPSVALERLHRDAVRAGECVGAEAARRFFEDNFVPYRILPEGRDASGQGFVTAYYEPVVEGRLERSSDFAAPILCRPPNFARLGPGDAARPYPPRAAIEADAMRGAYRALVWLRDWAEVFFVQVQGCARVELPGGEVIRLVYDGRNGQPYTSIGRVLADSGEVAAEDLSLGTVKAWIRAHGQDQGQKGRALMQRNRSYVFFRAQQVPDGAGPTGGAGVPLTPLRSIAIDRSIWAYGVPFWIDAILPWQGAGASPFRRLMIAQDTGSAILGPARADLFFGSGEEAGARAGVVRHPAGFTVLLPRSEPPDPANLCR